MANSIDEEQRQNIARILISMDEWNLRVSALEIKLMYNQLQANPQLPGSYNWLENAATAIVDMFQLIDSSLSEESNQEAENNSVPNQGKEINSNSSDKTSNVIKMKKLRSVWMIPYLVKNLRFLQIKVLKVSSHHLEQGNWSRGTISKSSSRPSTQQLAAMEANTTAAIRFSVGHQPFLKLVLTCLRELELDSTASGSSKSKDIQKSDYAAGGGGGIKTEREEQKENLLQSLHVQLSTFLCFTKDEKLYNYEDPAARKAMQDALQVSITKLLTNTGSNKNFIY